MREGEAQDNLYDLFWSGTDGEGGEKEERQKADDGKEGDWRLEEMGGEKIVMEGDVKVVVRRTCRENAGKG